MTNFKRLKFNLTITDFTLAIKYPSFFLLHCSTMLMLNIWRLWQNMFYIDYHIILALIYQFHRLESLNLSYLLIIIT